MPLLTEREAYNHQHFIELIQTQPDTAPTIIHHFCQQMIQAHIEESIMTYTKDLLFHQMNTIAYANIDLIGYTKEEQLHPTLLPIVVRKANAEQGKNLLLSSFPNLYESIMSGQLSRYDYE